MNNVILIGMPSCGKSTVGVLLAKALGYKFIDSDLLIQERTGALLHQTISEKGVDGFLEIEDDVLSSICAEKAVIATGGSAVYGVHAMEHLRSIGTVIYLKISFKTLSERLGDYVHRGVVLRGNSTLREMYDERVPLYEKYADITIDESECGGGTLSETVQKAIKVLESYL